MTHFRKENRDFLSGLGLQGHGFDPWSRELTSHVPPGSSAHGTSPDKNTGEGCHSLLQGIFPTQGSNLGLLHCRQILYPYVYLCVSRSVVSDSVTPWTQNTFKFVQ